MAWSELEFYRVGIVFRYIAVSGKLYILSLHEKVSSAACDSLSQALSYIQIMLGFGSRAFSDVYSAWLIQTNILFFIIGLVCMTPIVKQVIEKFRDHIRYGEYAVGALYLLLFLVSIACIISSTYQSFLYTQF